MIDYLKNFIGIKYKLGGELQKDGFSDCSSLVLEGLRSEGLWGKTDARAQDIYNKFSLKIVQKASPNCLLFFGESITKITHVAVCIDDKKMIEAGGTDEEGMVRIRPMTWRKDLVAIIKVMP